MSFSQWFWKYGYLVIPLVVALLWFFTGEKFQNRDKVNPEIFISFKNIEQQCSAENFNNLSRSCSEIQKYKKECEKLSSNCDSKTFYDLLTSLGYPLPSYLTK